MPCWVAPAVAAEMWGMPVDHVMDKIRHGVIPTKVEAGFLFVDIMPAQSALVAARPTEPPPSTYTAVSEAELEALAGSILDDPETALATAPAFIATPFLMEASIRYAEDEEEGVEPFEDEETPEFSAKDWRRVRAQTGRLRKPPHQMAETHAA